MKQIKLILAGLAAFLFLSTKSPAQVTNAAYFKGKWDVLAAGTPGGDKHMLFTISEADGKLTGTLTDPDTKKDVPLTKVEKDEKGIVLYFTSQGYDVSVTLQKKDDDHVIGSLMGMFDCTGDRVKSTNVPPVN